MNPVFKSMLCLLTGMTVMVGWAAAEEPTALWQPRSGHGMTVFRGLLVVAGGMDAFDLQQSFNDVWTSEDGAIWVENRTDASFFPPRQLHGLVTFQDAIWVLGGQSDTYLNDVWRSNDGIAWEKRLPEAPWSARSGMACVTHNGKLYLLGGKGANNELYNDSWVTDDGINWVPLTSGPWAARWEHAAVSFRNRLWIIGGTADYKDYPEVWHSEDGAEWIQTDTPPPFALRGHCAAVFNNKLYVTGGSADNQNPVSKVWVSEDGENWTVAVAAAPWAPRTRHAMATRDKSLWLAGGMTENNEVNDVWYTNDGLKWQAAPEYRQSCIRCSRGCKQSDLKQWRLFLGDWLLIGMALAIMAWRRA